MIFLDMDSGLRQYPDLIKEYFGTLIPAADNKFSALNSAVWSGGSFIYVPKNTHVEMPLQAYFRINAENMGQFERTLIIADEGSRVHYIEGCTAPTYSSDSLHSAVVELIAKPGAHIRYTTIQNWSNNVYNLVTKRAVAYEGATVEWVDGNLGSKVTIKYPAVYLLGRGARADILSVAFAGAGQSQDAGGKVIHAAPDTTSTITSKSISKDGGQGTYRRLLEVALPRAPGIRSRLCVATRCCWTSRATATRTRPSRSTRSRPTSATRRRLAGCQMSRSSLRKAADSPRRRPRRSSSTVSLTSSPRSCRWSTRSSSTDSLLSRWRAPLVDARWRRRP